jgi:hypothetical protein
MPLEGRLSREGAIELERWLRDAGDAGVSR